MAATVAMLQGVTPQVVWESGNDGVARLLWCLDDTSDPVGGRRQGVPGRIGEITVVNVKDLWGRAGRARRARRCAVRQALLEEHLERAMSSGRTIEESVRLPSRENELHWLEIRAGVALWWEARMGEGYTVDMARTMLGLIAQPEVFAQFTFTSERGPHCVRPRCGPPIDWTVAVRGGRGWCLPISLPWHPAPGTETGQVRR